MSPQNSSQGVSLQFLLEGAVYALDQAGLLLHDAHLLYKNQRFGSAIVMALFSREEIGRYRLLRQLRKAMIETGKLVTVKDIDDACDDHVKKQRLGQFGLLFKATPGQQIWELLVARMNNHYESAEYQEADRRINAITKQMIRTLPHDRHELRQRALYVEPAELGQTWNRPKERTKDVAFEQIQDTSNAYNMALDRFLRQDLYRQEDPTFYDDLQAWKDCPLMPNPLGKID